VASHITILYDIYLSGGDGGFDWVH